jgi:hypothetical protein
MLLVLTEAQTGLAKLGTTYAFRQEPGVTPDFVAIYKYFGKGSVLRLVPPFRPWRLSSIGQLKSCVRRSKSYKRRKNRPLLGENPAAEPGFWAQSSVLIWILAPIRRCP